MPYDPNYPYGYNPYGTNYRAPVQTNTYAFVNGIEGAKSYIVQPNQTVLLMDSDAPVCYMKQANGLGQSTLRYFKLIEVKESDLRTSNNIPTETTQYSVSKDEDFVALRNRVEELEKELSKAKKTKKEE